MYDPRASLCIRYERLTNKTETYGNMITSDSLSLYRIDEVAVAVVVVVPARARNTLPTMQEATKESVFKLPAW
jgi:hypothetical protein